MKSKYACNSTLLLWLSDDKVIVVVLFFDVELAVGVGVGLGRGLLLRRRGRFLCRRRRRRQLVVRVQDGRGVPLPLGGAPVGRRPAGVAADHLVEGVVARVGILEEL